MKQTIKTSRVAGQLEKMFRALNNRFFDGELPEVVISLKKTAGAYGHFTTGKVWKTGEERRYEINMQYDYYSCPYEPDTGIPPCGEMPECQTCSWCYLADSEK